MVPFSAVDIRLPLADKSPEGQVTPSAARSNGSIVGFVGLLAEKNGKVSSLEEINAATAQAWAGKK